MSRFTEAERAVIRTLADVLIPEAEGMPSATGVGATEAPLDQVLNFRPDLVPELRRVVRTVGDGDPVALETLKTNDPEGYAALTLAVAAAYYTLPAVRALLGYTGPERREVDVDAAPDCLDLLAPVITRGPLWRGVPPRSQ